MADRGQPEINRLLSDARAELDRVAPADFSRELARGALVVDIRPASDREADGSLEGAVVVERIHLEWRLDPRSPHRLGSVEADTRVIVVCNEGYASSLAAAVLRQLGLGRATDLAGGYRGLQAWAGAARPDDPRRRRAPRPQQ